MNMIRRLLASVLVLSAVPLAAQTPHLSGTITYRERMALPPTAVVDVRIDDVTRAGVVPPVVAATRIEQPGQVPIKFELPYDTRAIDARGRYAVRATISDGGVVIFASLDTALVLTQGHGFRADLVLTRVAGSAPAPVAPKPAPAAPLPPNPVTNLPATFTGTTRTATCDAGRIQLNLFPDDSFFARTTCADKPGEPVDDLGSWALSSDHRILVIKGRGKDVQTFTMPGSLARGAFRPLGVRLPMRGAYSPSAEGANFVECTTGHRLPVAADGAGKDLAAAYAAAKPAAGATVMAEIEGALVDRGKGEGAADMTLVAEKFVRLVPGESCAPRFTSAPFADTYWRLTHLGERAIPAPADPRRELSLTFQAPAGSSMGAYSGSSGCNRMIGTYEMGDESLTLTGGGTAMACKDAAATEAAFLASLKATRTYRIAGRMLELFDAKGIILARFEARSPSGITIR